jgi:hypothetical protein
MILVLNKRTINQNLKVRSLESFKSRSIPLSNTFYAQQFCANLTDYELNSVVLLLVILFLGEGHINFPGLCTLSYAQLSDFINVLATL